MEKSAEDGLHPEGAFCTSSGGYCPEQPGIITGDSDHGGDLGIYLDGDVPGILLSNVPPCMAGQCSHAYGLLPVRLFHERPLSGYAGRTL